MDILFFYLVPFLAGKAFTAAIVFWFFMVAANYVTGNQRLVEDSDGVYRATYTSPLANKLAGWTFMIMVLSWIPLFSVFTLDW